LQEKAVVPLKLLVPNSNMTHC